MVLASIPEYEKVIVWCKYVESVKQIAEMLPGCALYYGQLSNKVRAIEMERWRGSERFLDDWIMKHIGMDIDELLRLKQISGLAALFKDRAYSRAWE